MQAATHQYWHISQLPPYKSCVCQVNCLANYLPGKKLKKREAKHVGGKIFQEIPEGGGK